MRALPKCYTENDITKKCEELYWKVHEKKGDSEILNNSFNICGLLNQFKKEWERVLGLVNIVFELKKHNDFKAASLAFKDTIFQVKTLAILIMKSKKRVGVKQSKKGLTLPQWIEEEPQESIDLRSNGKGVKYDKLNFLTQFVKPKLEALAARYFIDNNIRYLEQTKMGIDNKTGYRMIYSDYEPRKRILESAVWWCNQLMLNIFDLEMPRSKTNSIYCDMHPNTIIFSTFPSSGKSYLFNTVNEMFVQLARIIQNKGGVLRIGNEEGNILRQSRQTMNLILNPYSLDIYEENLEFLSKGGKYDPFGKSAEEEWGLKGCENEPNTCVFKTRDSAINSIRTQLGIFDDPSRGEAEKNNIEKHKEIRNLYNGDFMDRFERQDKRAVILGGTMYNPFDVFSLEIQNALKDGFTRDTRFLNTYISKDQSTIIIVNDCEDEYGNSAYPEFISTKDLHRKRNSLPAYEYHCVWRQKPIPAEGLIFDRSLLQFYEKLPESISNTSYAYIDPTRRNASDFFSMPIFKYDTENVTDFYLIDVIFIRKASKDLLDQVVNKVLAHNIVWCGYEENIDKSYGQLIDNALTEKGAKWCKIELDYQTKNKQARIADTADGIKRHIHFPICDETTQMGYAIRQLMEYNGEKSLHDDFPDSIAGFISLKIMNNKGKNYIKSGRNKPV